jgi:hypothetical protein
VENLEKPLYLGGEEGENVAKSFVRRACTKAAINTAENPAEAP